jgi:prepilin-type N-terminal cleavage/methylation domain-containing protein
MKRRSVANASGFTLIELMVVVGIIGVLSSVAIPTFQRLTIRSKAAERAELCLRIHKAVSDFYVTFGKVGDPTDPGSTELIGDWQPALPLSIQKRIPNWRAPGWFDVFKSSEEVMGTTYYSYRFDATEPSGSTPAQLVISALGDLDGDSIASAKTYTYVRDNGFYRLSSEDPAPGQEDLLTF